MDANLAVIKGYRLNWPKLSGLAAEASLSRLAAILISSLAILNGEAFLSGAGLLSRAGLFMPRGAF
jgi:hypothetical protein